MTHVEARLRDKDAAAEAWVANAKDELLKDYRGKLAKVEARYTTKLDEVNREKDQIQGEKAYAIQEMEKQLADLQEKLEKAQRLQKVGQEDNTLLAREAAELKRHLDPLNRRLEKFKKAERDEGLLRSQR